MNTLYFDGLRFSVTIEVECQHTNLTNAEIAELAGIGASTLYAIKNGTKTPSMAEFTHLCNIFDLSPLSFFKTGKVNNGEHH